jgi:hypothetical protein
LLKNSYNAEKLRKVKMKSEKFRIESGSVFIASAFSPAKSHKKAEKGNECSFNFKDANNFEKCRKIQ